MLLALPACLPPAHAAGSWAILTDDGVRSAASLEFSADGTSLLCRTPPASAEPVPLKSVSVLMQQITPATSLPARGSHFFLALSSGERVLSEAAQLANGKVRVVNRRWGDPSFDLESVLSLTAGDSRLADPSGDFTGVRYLNGDTVPGAIAALAREDVTVDMEGIGKIPIHGFSNVADIVFVKDAAIRPLDGEALIALLTGELLRGKATGAGQTVELRTSWSAKPLSIPLEMVASVLFPEGRTVLSDIAPKSAVETPFLGFQRHWQRNRSLTGNILSVGGFTAARGLALHSRTVLEFALPSTLNAGALVAWAGIDDAIPAGKTSAELRVAVDGGLAKTLRLQPAGGPAPVQIEIPTNAAILTITADYGEFGSVGDHVDILYPCLVPRKIAP